MEAGDLLDRLGQGVDRAAGRVGGKGEQSRAELVDEPGGAVAAAGAGAVGGAEPIQHHGQARSEDARPVLIRGVGAARLGGEGGAHHARLSARYSGVTRSLLMTWRLSGSNRQAMMVEKRPVRTSPYSSTRYQPRPSWANPRLGSLASTWAMIRDRRGPQMTTRLSRFRSTMPGGGITSYWASSPRVRASSQSRS